MRKIGQPSLQKQRHWKGYGKRRSIAHAQATPPPPVSERDDDEQRLNERVSSFAESAAASEEQAFTAALTDMQQAASAQGDRATRPPPPRRSSGAPQPFKSGQDLREAAMRRIAEARRYAGDKGGTRPPAVQASPAQASAPPQPGSAPDATLGASSAVEWGQSGVDTSQQVPCRPSRHRALCMRHLCTLLPAVGPDQSKTVMI